MILIEAEIDLGPSHAEGLMVFGWKLLEEQCRELVPTDTSALITA